MKLIVQIPCFFLFDPVTRDLHAQSLILAAILLSAGFQMILTGIVADLVNSHRAISEDISYRLRQFELRDQDKPPGNETPT